MITVIVTFFGVLGVIRESVHVFLVFDVFMFFRLIAIYYVPYFDSGIASNSMLCIITLLAFAFTYMLIRKPHFDERHKLDIALPDELVFRV